MIMKKFLKRYLAHNQATAAKSREKLCARSFFVPKWTKGAASHIR